mgnify:CR=1 FL=1
MNDNLVFLGTGGGRYNTATQHRQTGGIIYVFDNVQMHIDPGPGAIVYLNKYHIDRFKTKWVVVTHNHTDHNNDAPIIIESLHKSLKNKKGTLITTEEYLRDLPRYYKDLLEEEISVSGGEVLVLQSERRDISVRTKPIVHGQTQGFGFILEQAEKRNGNSLYSLAYTSDTEIHSKYAVYYKGVDILVANVLRPNDRHCPRHATIEELIPAVKKILPKCLIITHFGGYMDSSWSGRNLVPQQVAKIQDALGNKTRVIGAKDGMKLNLEDLI